MLGSFPISANKWPLTHFDSRSKFPSLEEDILVFTCGSPFDVRVASQTAFSFFLVACKPKPSFPRAGESVSRSTANYEKLEFHISFPVLWQASPFKFSIS